MAQAYSDPEREEDPYALPDVEIFYADDLMGGEGELLPAGWYYWACFPGCLPDGEPYGPFESEEEAEEDMRDNWGPED